MNPDELAKYRVMAEQLRKARRQIEAQAAQLEALYKENAALKSGLLSNSADFDSENQELFQAVHRNHRTRSPFERTYYYGT